MEQSVLLLLDKTIEAKKEEAVRFLQKLIRFPSVNKPPAGYEKAVQEFYFGYLRSIGLKCDMFEPDKIPGFKNHPARLKSHDMKDRPDVSGVLKGEGGSKSMFLVSHADVESPGDELMGIFRVFFSVREACWGKKGWPTSLMNMSA